MLSRPHHPTYHPVHFNHLSHLSCPIWSLFCTRPSQSNHSSYVNHPFHFKYPSYLRRPVLSNYSSHPDCPTHSNFLAQTPSWCISSDEPRLVTNRASTHSSGPLCLFKCLALNGKEGDIFAHQYKFVNNNFNGFQSVSSHLFFIIFIFVVNTIVVQSNATQRQTKNRVSHLPKTP